MSNDEDLFKLFSPTYHFDEPIKSNDSDWCIVAEQSILVEEEIFWNVIKKWTLEPELVIPPLKKCDIVEQTQSDAAATERITRDLISKRKSKDPILREQVEYYPGSENCPARVTYTPVVTDAKQLPFYYPKVRAYSFVFDCVQDDNAEAQHGSEAAIRLEIQPFRPSETGISDDKMIYALCEVFHKLYKWCIHTSLGYEKRAKHDVLVPKEMYHTTYAQIKAKYAETIISQWTEKTDATKFVFEDIAIASYLICLWELERQRTGQSRLQSFIDLGCGNGLLTHLLVSEGYPGKGIDLAKRKIWDKLSPDYLIAQSLHPPTESYPNVDWLIGNHADELVPWIPIMAARTDSRFLVIPCCYFQLDGSRHKGLSGLNGGKYREYTEYIKDIGVKCGYCIDEDQLRIPSTRNIAVVGQRRNPEAVVDPVIASVGHFVARVSDRELEQERRKRAAEKGK